MFRSLVILIFAFTVSACANNNGKQYSFKKKFDVGIEFEQARAQCEYDLQLQNNADIRAGRGGSRYYSMFGMQDPTYISCMNRFGYALEYDSNLTDLNRLNDAQKSYLAKDFQQSFNKYMVLANEGNATAQAWIGHFYHNGQGVSQDDKESARWYKLSAIQGLKESQFIISNYYMVGVGLEKNPAKSLLWIYFAKENGVDVNVLTLEKLASEAEISSGKEMYRKCKSIGLQICVN